jgi:hypothetical protein
MFRSERVFQVWSHKVGHSSLLLRSPREHASEKTIDLWFAGVSFMCIPTIFRGVSVERAQEPEEKLATSLGPSVPRGGVVWALRETKTYLVVAAAVQVYESTLDIFEVPDPVMGDLESLADAYVRIV